MSAAQRAIRLSTGSPDWKNTLVDANVLLGIICALKSDSTSAERHFDEALQLDNQHFLAQANRNVLREIKTEVTLARGTDMSKEVIDNIAFNTINLNADNKKAEIATLEDYKITLLTKSFDHSKVLANASVTGTGSNKIRKNTFLHFTAPGYDLPSAKGSKVGDSLQSVLDKYGAPQARMSLGNGAFLRYKNDDQLGSGGGVIFEFADQKLLRWCVYRQTK
ncbi:MAG: hypothetical protein IPM82_16295 [Saprospiraceae bacterium]|nr:hypothetical protein [Saprospiraceae bacterium]